MSAGTGASRYTGWMRRKLALAAILLAIGAASTAIAPIAMAQTVPPSTAPVPKDPRQGIVRLERGGQLLGYGVVLRADGRVLTALSAVGHGNDLQARYSDGAALPLSVVATDRVWDLALLSSGGVHWAPGLRPSTREPAPNEPGLRRYRLRGGRLEEAPTVLVERSPLIGRDGAVLADMFVTRERVGSDELGGPLIDSAGEVVAIAVQACSPDSGGVCRMATFGAPVQAIKSFLKKAPPREPLPAARLGFKGASAHIGSVAGVRILSVEPGSPAARAGLRAWAGEKAGESGDLVVAVEDVPVTTAEELNEGISRAAARPPKPDAPGSAAPAAAQVRLLVYGSGRFRQAELPLEALPRIVEPAPSVAPAPAASPKAPSAPAAPNPPGGAPSTP